MRRRISGSLQLVASKGILVKQRSITGSRSRSTKITTRSFSVQPSATSAKSCVEMLVCLCKMGLGDLF